MQPSYVYCKICGHTLNYVYVRDLRKRIELPTDDEGDFALALSYARKFIKCPRCRNQKWIRKVWWKV